MFELIKDELHKIAVIGLGCCGANAVSFVAKDIDESVDLYVLDTDARTISGKQHRISGMAIGSEVTQGRSAGAIPDVGRQAALEASEELQRIASEYDLIFLAGGLGGGTATGALPVIAEAITNSDTVTVSVVTTPFEFEGKKKQRFSQEALNTLYKVSDSVVKVSNQKLLQTLPKSCTLLEAFDYSNQVLKRSLLGIYELISSTGFINLDFADVKTVLKGSGRTVIGHGHGEGNSRIQQAINNALHAPLLDEFSPSSSTGVLINVTAGVGLSLEEFHQVGESMALEILSDIPIIVGTTIDPSMDEKVEVFAIFSGVKSSDPNLLSKPHFQVLDGRSFLKH
ncbi:hypothetical protein BCU83_04185 [Vibrio breoganii]|uniref:cell division protein FtsZ n=1 Tax=Vibrio breoganii TaxID=553239 RepID=UPI000CB39080|nr:cell division protein FtsZ [Vibrio breoganii]PMG86416.1 hypothetical protein BCU83_04185 [Vibrio breoganii]